MEVLTIDVQGMCADIISSFLEFYLSIRKRIKIKPKGIMERKVPMEVLIIDDQGLYADGIRTLLESHDPEVMTLYANNVFTAYEKIKNSNCLALILLDINTIATENSYDLISRLAQLKIDIPVMVISNSYSSAAAGLAIENNASGFITKNCSRETTLEAILSVLDGNMYVRKPKQQTSTSTSSINKKTNSSAFKVTFRQQEVLVLLSKGLLNKQIASELDISANTVKAHIHDLFTRFNVKNRTAAVQFGYKSGLI